MQDYIDSIARGETQIESQRSTQNCCEYVNNRGKTKHVFQLFCECNEVDESLEQIMTTGRIPNRTMCLRLEQDISDRIRFPWYGGPTVNLSCFPWSGGLVFHAPAAPR